MMEALLSIAGTALPPMLDGLRILTLIAGLAATGPAAATSIVSAPDVTPFRIGLLAERGTDRGVTGLDRLRAAFEKAMGRPVEIMVARDYASMIEAQAAGRLDYAVYSAMAYAVAWRKCECVEPLVAPVAANGETGMAAALFLRTDALRGAEDTPLAADGSALLTGLLLAARPQARPGRAGAEAAEASFASGTVGALLGWLPATGHLDTEGGSAARLKALGMDFSIAWTSAPVRFGPHAVRAEVTRADRARLLPLLNGLHESDPVAYEAMEQFWSGGFRPASHADYQAAIDILPTTPKMEQVAATPGE